MFWLFEDRDIFRTNKAANETAELMQQIEEQQTKAQNDILYSCEATVKSVLSDSDIDTIMDMAVALQRGCEVPRSLVVQQTECTVYDDI